MKIVFLDIDGVLNNEKTIITTSTGYDFIEDYKIQILKYLLNKTKAKVVLSSTWRLERDNPQRNQDFCELQDKLKEYGIEFYDYTPTLLRGRRQEEIFEWLKNNPNVENYTILDDSYDEIDKTLPNFFKTNFKTGLTREIAEEAIKFLNN